MRTSLLLAGLASVVGAELAFAQTVSRALMGAPPVRAAGAAGSPYRYSTWTAALPVTFSRLERESGSWQIGASMSVGGSFVFVTGKATSNGDGTGRLDPEFMIGPVANIGVTPNTVGDLDGTLMLGATIGFSSFAVLAGYDLLLERPVIGVGMQIQSLTFTERFTKRIRLR